MQLYALVNPTSRYQRVFALCITSRHMRPFHYMNSFLKKCILGTFALLALPLAPVIFLYRVIQSIKEKIALYFHLNETLPAIRRMKVQEEKNKFTAMQKVLHDSGIDLSMTPIEAAQNCTKNLCVDHPHLIAKEYKRQIILELNKQNSFSPSWMNSLIAWSIRAKNIDQEGNIDYSALLKTDLHPAIKSLLFTLDEKVSPYAERLSAKMHRKSNILKKITTHFQIHVQEFNQLLRELFQLLTDSIKLNDKNPTQANRNFIRIYRLLLEHPIYQVFKFDSEVLHISLLHNFACAIWNDVHSLNEYTSIGRAIIADANLQDQTNDSLTNILMASQSCVAKLHHANDNFTSRIRYGITHFWHMMGTLSSEGGWLRFLPSLLGIEYDSHGTLSNNPSLQGTTYWCGPLIKGAVNNCYGGTPTIGDDKIAPEFNCLLQAIENNVLDPKARESPRILSQVIFNNLQNIDKFHGEGPRSRTLMHLNETYPLSIKGTILAKDSDLYLMKTPKDVIWENSNQFGNILKAKLLLGLHAPDKKGHGFYFSRDCTKWEHIFDAIINTVSLQFSNSNQFSTLEEKMLLQGAYQEYVYALLISVIECQTIHGLNAAGIADPLITALTACKENIDRGGMENMKYMYLRLPFNPLNKDPISKNEQLEYLVGVMNSRSLSVRDRAILKNRMHQTLSFIEKVTPEQFNRTLTDILHVLNLQANMTYTPDTGYCMN